MAETTKVPTDPAFSAPDVEGESPRGRNQRQEGIPMKAPIAVVARRPGPRDPGLGIVIPSVTEHVDILASDPG